MGFGPSSGVSINATPEELASLGALEVISAGKFGNFGADLNL